MNLELSNASCATVTDYPTGTRFAGTWKDWINTQLLRLQVRRERRELAELPLHLLKDIGIDPHAAHIESIRPFTDLPENRLR